jgi:hypothetical protein
MKKTHLVYLIASILFIACESEQGPTGLQGSNGINSLINISVETTGSNCVNGGLKIETGLDNNFNGILENNEVQNTRYVCNGINGNNSLTTAVKEPAGTNCENGGIRINSGLDLNRNSALEENEITSTAYICNGINGNTSLTRTTNENSGGNCGNGGLKIDYGLDLNKDGILNDNEVKYTTYSCNGLNGNLSLVNITDESKGFICENGGIKIESGIDLNNNKTLENVEVQMTKYVCNGNEGILNEEIRLKIADGIGSNANTTSSTPVVVSGITFDIRNFININSVIFESDPYVSKNTNYALLELYNVTDNVVIAKSLIRTNNLYNIKEDLKTNELINELPQKEIKLGIRLSSETNGEFSASGIGYLVLKNNN